jgi:hypothetical protein
MSPAGRIRAAADESLLVRVLRQLFVAITTGPARPSAAPSDIEFDDMVDMLLRARVGRPVAATIGAVGNTWRHSRAAAALHEAAKAIAQLGLVDRVRAAGVAIVTAALTDLALTPLDPRPVSTARWSMWLAAFVVGIAIAAWPHHAVAAWLERRGGRERHDAGHSG